MAIEKETAKTEKMENLTDTIYDFVERTLKDQSTSPQALAIVPSLLDRLEKCINQKEDAKERV